jgi:tetratricopeptide (TPR) repeat protein
MRVAALSVLLVLAACSERGGPGAEQPESRAPVRTGGDSAAAVPGPAQVDAASGSQPELPPAVQEALKQANAPAPQPQPGEDRARVALQLIARNHPDQAEPVARALLAAHPDQPRAAFVLGLSLHKQKRYGDAVPLFESALAGANAIDPTRRAEQFPEHAHVAHFLGWARYYAGDLAGARGAFASHVAAVPTAGDSWYGLALVEIDEDQVDDAAAALERAYACLPEAERIDDARSRDRGKILARQGDLALRADRTQDAIELYRRALRAWPDHYEVWAKVARCYDRLGDAEAADRARVEELKARERMGRLTDAPKGSQP